MQISDNKVAFLCLFGIISVGCISYATVQIYGPPRPYRTPLQECAWDSSARNSSFCHKLVERDKDQARSTGVQ